MSSGAIPIRRFEEPPPVDYGNVPAVLKWLVKAMLHLDTCFDSRLSAIEGASHDSRVRGAFIKQQVAIVTASVSLGGGIVYLTHLLHFI